MHSQTQTRQTPPLAHPNSFFPPVFLPRSEASGSAERFCGVRKTVPPNQIVGFGEVVPPRRGHGGGATIIPSLLLAILAFLAAGCTSLPDRPRPTLDGLTERATDRLPAGPLTLDACIGLALAHNLDLELAAMRTRLRELDRNAAFSQFLPQVELQASRYGTDNPRLLNAAGGAVQMSDQHITHFAVSLQQGIFIPQAWLLYGMFRQGVEIERLLEERLRQQIALQTAARYYACLQYAVAGPALASGVAQAEALAKDTRALAAAGLAMQSDADGADLLLQARRLAQANNARNRREAEAALLAMFGVSPLASLELQPPAAAETAPEPAGGDLAALAAEALEARLELRAADSLIALRRNDVRRALAAFLPNVGLTGEWSNSSDSFLHYGSVWSYGLAGVLTVFDGFRNVSEYRAAKIRHEQAFVEREQRCLAVILEVLAAEHRRQQAAAAAALAAARLRLQDEVLRQQTAGRREGLLTAAGLLGNLAKRDMAAAEQRAAEYAHLLALAAWRDVLGRNAADMAVEPADAPDPQPESNSNSQEGLPGGTGENSP